MPNPYFNYTNDFIPGTRIPSRTVDEIFSEVEAGFDLLADPDILGNGAQTGGTDSGASDAYVVATPTENDTPTDKQLLVFTPSAASTGASTLALNNGAQKPIRRNNGQVTQANDLLAGIPLAVIWDATNDFWTIVGATDQQSKEGVRPSVSTVTGEAYTLSPADEGSVILFTSAAAVTVTVPNDAANIPVGAIYHLHQFGAGKVSASAASGVTVNTAVTLSARAQYSSISLIKTGANAWVLVGDSG